MDPNACIDRIIDALIDGDLEEAREAMVDLQSWIARGGFLPGGDRLDVLTAHPMLREHLDADKHPMFGDEPVSREEWLRLVTAALSRALTGRLSQVTLA
jgi:hypothetical protein